MDLNLSIGNKMPSQEHLNFINKLNDAKIPRQSQLIANRLFMKNFPRETTGAEIEHYFHTFGPVHDVKIIAKENTHFAFISFVNESTALDVLRQHSMTPLMFQNRPIILAPAYKKISLTSLTSPTSYYPAGGSAITPPPTPSRTAVNGHPQQSSTPYHQHQQQQQQQQQQQSLSGSHPVYPPIFFPVQTNMPFVPMTGTYIISPGPAPGHPQQISAPFYPTFYSQGSPHQSGAPLINRAFIPPPYVYSMGAPGPAPTALYQSSTAPSDVSISSDY